MDTTAAPRVKLLALIGLIAAVGLAAGMFFMSRAGADANAAAPLPPPAVIKPKPAATTKPAAVKPAPVKAKPAPTAKPAATAKPKPVAQPKPKPVVKAKPKPKPSVIAPNGLPTALVQQLARHDVVVAAVFAGGAAVDTLARDEAQAGAGDAHVGFAALDVSDNRIAKALAKKTELLTAPAVLVFAKNGEVKARFDGFADRILVAELAASAR